MELTNSPVANSGGVGDDDYDYDDLFREEEDTGEEGNINIPRPAKKSKVETKKMSDDELFLYFCHRPWYWREIYPDYGASRRGKTQE